MPAELTNIINCPVPGSPRFEQDTVMAITRLRAALGPEGTPAFGSITLPGLTDNTLIYADADGVLASVTLGSSLTFASPPTLNTIQGIRTADSPTFAGLTLTGFSGILQATAGVVSGDAPLNALANMTANKTFNNAAYSVSFNFTNPTNQPTYDGAFEIQASGAFVGDLFHVHQHTGNPGADTHLVKLEAEDADVHLLHMEHSSSSAMVIHLLVSDVETFRMIGSGEMNWGSAQDVNLYRGGSNLLQTDDGFRALSLSLDGVTTITEFSIDGTLADNSDTAVPTEKAVKTYVAATGHAAVTIGTLPGITLTGQQLDLTAGYVIPTTTEESNWNTAYGWGDHFGLYDVLGSASAAISGHEFLYNHANIHARQHSITSTSDHTSTATSGQMLKADANGLPVDATNTDAQVASAVTNSHVAVTLGTANGLSLAGQQLSLPTSATPVFSAGSATGLTIGDGTDTAVLYFKGNTASGMQFWAGGAQKWNYTSVATSNDFKLYNNGGISDFAFNIKYSNGYFGIGVDPALERLHVNGKIRANTAFNINGTDGASGTFTTADSKTVTVSGGIITAIV